MTATTAAPRDDPDRLTEKAGVVIGIATGVLGGLLAVGFALLPASTGPEKGYIITASLALSIASVSGIGAWQSRRRFAFTMASTGISVICLAALSIAAEAGPAQAPQSIAMPATSSTGNARPISTQPTIKASAPSTQLSTSAASASTPATPRYVQEYNDVPFTLTGSGCGSGFDSAYVNFYATGPKVTTNGNGVGDLDLNCGNPGVVPNNGEVYVETIGDQSASVSGNPDAAGCNSALNLHPMGDGIQFSLLVPGKTQACIAITDGYKNVTQIVRIVLVSANQTTYDTEWSATAWSISSGT